MNELSTHIAQGLGSLRIAKPIDSDDFAYADGFEAGRIEASKHVAAILRLHDPNFDASSFYATARLDPTAPAEPFTVEVLFSVEATSPAEAHAIVATRIRVAGMLDAEATAVFDADGERAVDYA